MAYKILLVEDDIDIRAILKKAFESEKATVFEAANCAEAEALFRREKPELVYLDIFLQAGEIGLDLIPVFSGSASPLPGSASPPRPRVVVCSGEIGKDVFNTLGFNHPDKVDLFVSKPFDPKDLVSKITRLAQTPLSAKQVPVPKPAPKTPESSPEAHFVPRSAREHFIVGLRKFASDDMEGALKLFSQAIELDPNHGGAYSYRAFCRDRLGDKAGAEADFEKCNSLGGL